MSQVLRYLGRGDTFLVAGLVNGGGAEGDDVLIRVDSITRTGQLNCSLIQWELSEEGEFQGGSISVSLASINMADFEVAVKYGWYVPGSYSWYDEYNEMKAN